MINYLHGILHRPEGGWDPVPKEYAHSYGEKEWGIVNEREVEFLAERLGGLEGKRILDLGGGAGQYSISFAKRGAQVVWHDISGNYREIVLAKAAENGVEVECSLGYMEAARKFEPASFDAIFCRLCWYYCREDRPFARLIHGLLKAGGIAYLNVPVRSRSPRGAIAHLQASLYDGFGVKIGHPFPLPGRVPALLAALAPRAMEVDFSSGKNEKIVLTK
jgi:2-polyprenyl-3-methyl-5-hydroxy-6-metoxy-1,4-benzoquinol methylase